jgi:hypothetical protein
MAISTLKAYTGASGNVVVSATPLSVTGFTFNGGAAGATFKVYDNATTNSGTILFAATVATNAEVTYLLPTPLKAANGVTINASAAGGAGSVHASGNGGSVAKSVAGATATNVVVTAVAGSKVNGFSVNASNTGGASVLTVYDNATTSSGTILYQETIPTQTAATTLLRQFWSPVAVANGVTLSVATTAVGDITFWVS